MNFGNKFIGSLFLFIGMMILIQEFRDYQTFQTGTVITKEIKGMNCSSKRGSYIIVSHLGKNHAVDVDDNFCIKLSIKDSVDLLYSVKTNSFLKKEKYGTKTNIIFGFISISIGFLLFIKFKLKVK